MAHVSPSYTEVKFNMSLWLWGYTLIYRPTYHIKAFSPGGEKIPGALVQLPEALEAGQCRSCNFWTWMQSLRAWNSGTALPEPGGRTCRPCQQGFRGWWQGQGSPDVAYLLLNQSERDCCLILFQSEEQLFVACRREQYLDVKIAPN